MLQRKLQQVRTQEKGRGSEWFDEECENVIKEKRKAMVEGLRTQNVNVCAKYKE